MSNKWLFGLVRYFQANNFGIKFFIDRPDLEQAQKVPIVNN